MIGAKFFSVLVAMAGLADNPNRFDLDCQGSQTDLFQGQVSTTPHHILLHVDALSKTFCINDCKTVEPLSLITDRLIVFDDDLEPGRGGMYTSETRIDGHFIGRSELGVIDGSRPIRTFQWDDHCTVKPLDTPLAGRP